MTKLHNQLDASSDRIWRTRPAEEATKIVALLRDLINSHTETQTYKFSWNLSLYINPPKKGNKVTNMFLIAVLQSFVFTTQNHTSHTTTFIKDLICIHEDKDLTFHNI